MKKRTASEKTRREILAAALKLFTEKGFYSSTIKDLAELVSLSVGAVYNHFNSKEEIAYVLFKESISLFKKALADSTRESRNPKDFVIRTVKTVLIFSQKNIRISKYLWLCRHDEFLREFASNPSLLTYDEFGKLFSRHINFARKNKLIKPYPPAVIWTIIFGVPLSYIRDWLDNLIKLEPSRVSNMLSEAVWMALQFSNPAS
ncbi:MAG: TetR/AcrR family transcriptional regulator [Deltaproteobacteria bacterium]|nr:TetR/AcrR family transcriptional regulator [Deltaproteobacteria bacterium]